MSDELLASALTVIFLAGLVLWVPTLDICNARCQKLLRNRAARKANAAGQPTEVELPNTSQA